MGLDPLGQVQDFGLKNGYSQDWKTIPQFKGLQGRGGI